MATLLGASIWQIVAAVPANELFATTPGRFISIDQCLSLAKTPSASE